MESKFLINEKGELVKKIGRAYFEVNGVHLLRKRILVLGYVSHREKRKK